MNVYMYAGLALGFLFTFQTQASSQVLVGKIQSDQGCVQPSQLFVSTDKKDLLYQVEVPINGSFSFNLKPGDYQFHAANEEGCASIKAKVKIPEEKRITLNLIRKQE